MSGRFLLDTSVIVSCVRGDNEVIQRVRAGSDHATSSICIGELLYGAMKSHAPEKNIEIIKAFTAPLLILPCDSVTSSHYAELKDSLRLEGKPIPESDLWIAATSIQHGMTLLSQDRHFSYASALTLELC